MTKVIATFILKDVFTYEDSLEACEMGDVLKEIAEKNDMEIVSWGTI